MSFVDHLEELRWRIARSLLAIGIFMIAAFLFKNILFDALIFAPSREDFFTYRVFCRLGQWLHLSDTLCIKPANFQLINTEMSGQFLMHIQVAVTIGFVAAFPYIFWEMWRFVEPGLLDEEKKYTKGIVAATSLLFFAGVLFGYFIISPFSINFLAGYYVSAQVANTIALTSYVSTISGLVLASGIMFQLPLVVYFLAYMGIITAFDMRFYRRHAFVVILIVAAIITPPDVFSQVLVTLPVCFLYEASIYVAERVHKHNKDFTPAIGHEADIEDKKA